MAYTLEYYQRKKNQAENELRNRQNKNARIRGEIQELETAYRKLGDIKRNNYHNAQKIRNNVKLNNVAGNVKWRGQSKKQFDNRVKNNLNRSAKEFYDSIDKMHDQIGTALDRKKGELSSGSRTVDYLRKQIINLGGIIRNWVN